MNIGTIVKRSLFYYWRTNLGIVLGVMVGTAVLTGALAVGDSVRQSLVMMVRSRLGGTEAALVSGGRFFRASLADGLADKLQARAAAVLELRGVISNSDGTKRANGVGVVGVDKRFYEIGGGGDPFSGDRRDGVVLNEALAGRLGVTVGDEVVLRIGKPGQMPRDVPLMPDVDLSVAFRLRVRAVAGAGDFGDFNLQANQVVRLNAFVRREWLGEKVGQAGRANVVLVGASKAGTLTTDCADEAIREVWAPADAELEIRRVTEGVIEVVSRRIFIDSSVAQAAESLGRDATAVLTYFVNEVRHGDKSAPYSVIAALGRLGVSGGLIPEDMGDDEIIINRWLADDVGAFVGDSLELSYYVVTSKRKLVTQSSRFKVRAIVDIKGAAADASLMPEFPGLSGVENCRDWEPGIPIELDKIRDKDEAYWDNYHGTPKAFVTIGAGRRMWANRYGNTTAIRYAAGEGDMKSLGRALLSKLKPRDVGLYFRAVGAEGLRAASSGTDFGQLFLGLSMFIIASSVVLTGLIFVFGVEGRSEEFGILEALGFSSKRVKAMFMLEGFVLACIGAAAGAFVGLGYTRLMLYGLSTIWAGAISGSRIGLDVRAMTVFSGAAVGVIVSLGAMWFSLFRQMRLPVQELLSGTSRLRFFKAGRWWMGSFGFVTGILGAAGALYLIIEAGSGDSASASGAFFGAGALLLIAGLGFSHFVLRKLAAMGVRPMVSLGGLGLRNCSRRVGRSLAVAGLVACGVFMVVTVAANRRNVSAEATRRDSGTGGFALYGESSIGLSQDLNSESGRRSVGLEASDFLGVDFVQLRVRDGDDASCFNLNRAQRPRLLGVEPAELQERGAFGFREVIEGAAKEKGWELLNRDVEDGVVPAIGDYATVIWALGKGIGDELEYTDEKGRVFRLRLVGMINSSILQGSLIISEEKFREHFPSEDGYRMFLVDAPEQSAKAVSQVLSRDLSDFGFEVTSTVERLGAFSEVEDTYLSIFQLLGGLGLILGSVGLGLVVLRNMLERRGELAMMRAVGFEKSILKRLVVYEHWGLMVWGMAWGVVCAMTAVGPALQSPGTEVPYLSLALTVAAIGGSGLLWIWAATSLAMSGGLLEALRNE